MHLEQRGGFAQLAVWWRGARRTGASRGAVVDMIGFQTQFSFPLGELFFRWPSPWPLVEADQLDNAARNRSDYLGGPHAHPY